MPDASSPIAVFDSGIGGLSVLVELRRLLPNEDLIYYADATHFPYGPRTAENVRALTEAAVRELLARDAKLIVIACNTATSAAIAHLRDAFAVPFVGMEPAVKPAAERTLTGVIALLATPATTQGEKLAALIDRYGAEVRVAVIPAPGLAERVEAAQLDDPGTRALVQRYVSNVIASGADALALGCTHYAFIRDLIEAEAGPTIDVIEPSAAIARQTRRLLDEHALLNPRTAPGGVLYLTSGDDAAFAAQRARLRDAGFAIPDPARLAAR